MEKHLVVVVMVQEEEVHADSIALSLQMKEEVQEDVVLVVQLEADFFN